MHDICPLILVPKAHGMTRNILRYVEKSEFCHNYPRSPLQTIMFRRVTRAQWNCGAARIKQSTNTFTINDAIVFALACF